MKQYQISAKDAKFKNTVADYEHCGDLDSAKTFARNIAISNAGAYGAVVYIYLNGAVVFRCEYSETII